MVSLKLILKAPNNLKNISRVSEIFLKAKDFLCGQQKIIALPKIELSVLVVSFSCQFQFSDSYILTRVDIFEIK